MVRVEDPWLKSDGARERELLRYFEPSEAPSKPSTKATEHSLSIENDDPFATTAPSSPETTLTALAQLCALQLNASRAMVRSVLLRVPDGEEDEHEP